MVLEGLPAELAAQITAKVSVPTIGIGAGVQCDGQVLVCYDLLGMNPDFKPKFVKTYDNLFERIVGAVQGFANDVKAGEFPAEEHSFHSRKLRLAAVEDTPEDDPAGEGGAVYSLPL